MRTTILHLIAATLLVITNNVANAQQNIIDDKDATRPEMTNPSYPARVVAFSAEKFNGYNEIRWASESELETRRYIVEYSLDGVNFQTVDEMYPNKGYYAVKHFTIDTRPMLYRIRVEKKDGRYYNAAAFMANGETILPVNIYPTVVTCNVVKVEATFSVERTAVTNFNGQQVFTKDLNGVTGYNAISVPSLQRGMYFMTFYGRGWQSTSKFVIN